MSAAKGAYGIPRTPWSPTALTCGTCWRSWEQDITPAARCPWEHLHGIDRRTDRFSRRRKAIIAGAWG